MCSLVCPVVINNYSVLIDFYINNADMLTHTWNTVYSGQLKYHKKVGVPLHVSKQCMYVCMYIYSDPFKCYTLNNSTNTNVELKFYDGSGHFSVSHSDCYWAGTNVINSGYP